MSYVNQVILVGNLGRDPVVLKQTKNGLFVRLRLATNIRKSLPNGDYAEDLQWHTVYLNGSTGKYAAEYLKKGNKVFAFGELRTKEYQKNGQTLYTTAVYAKECRYLCGKKPVDESASAEKTTTAPATHAANPVNQSTAAVEADDVFVEDEIPF